MAKDKQINSREEGMTKDMQPESHRKQRSWTVPGLGVTVKAETMQEAVKKAKDIIRKQKKQ